MRTGCEAPDDIPTSVEFVEPRLSGNTVGQGRDPMVLSRTQSIGCLAVFIGLKIFSLLRKSLPDSFIIKD
jgi:hypothetical protein